MCWIGSGGSPHTGAFYNFETHQKIRSRSFTPFDIASGSGIDIEKIIEQLNASGLPERERIRAKL